MNATHVANALVAKPTFSSTGIWFFKKPSPNDPWGVRFSAASHALAIHGLEDVRANFKALLNALGIDAPDNAYRPSRVDFAMDFIDPDFSPDPDLFVIHSRTGRKTIAEVDTIEVNAQSNRITSVTVGKMPGRQVIIYDKTLETIVKRKGEWPVIWRNAMGANLNGARVSVNATIFKDSRMADKKLRTWYGHGLTML